MNSQHKAQIVYLSHGGGPLPLLGDPSHQGMVRFMRDLSSRLRKPEAVLVLSAHWEEPRPTVQTAEHPGMLYDYFGFPEEAYSVRYPAPGAPEFAGKILRLLKDAGIQGNTDRNRGFDHGLFIPMMLIRPEADVPCLQLSLMNNLDPASHLALGRALSGLSAERILIIGSGFSFHNLRSFDLSSTDITDPRNDSFQDWLIETCVRTDDRAEREHRLLGWEAAPSARYCHPREEHLLPLHVCCGLAGECGEIVFDGPIAGKRSVAFLWE